MPRKRFIPQLEALEDRVVPSLSVLSSVNLIDGPYSATSPNDHPISVHAHGVGDATASADAFSLSVEASGGDGLSEGSSAVASGTWNFQITGVPQSVQIPLQFAYQFVGVAQASSSATSNGLNLSLASYEYSVSAGTVQQTGTQVFESENGALVYQYSANPTAPGTLSGTFSGSGSLAASIQVGATATPGEGATATSNAVFRLTGVTTSSASLASQYPNLALQFDDGQTMSADPFLVPEGQLTFDLERSPDSAYSKPKNSLDIYFPGGHSGVTIGAGYDMKFRTPQQVITDLTNAGVPPGQAEEIAQGAGIQPGDTSPTLFGSAAKEFVLDNRSTIGSITLGQQQQLFEDTYPSYVAKAEAQYSLNTGGSSDAVAWDNLDQAIRDVLTDIVYKGAHKSVVIAADQAAMTNSESGLADFIESTFPLNHRNDARISYLLNN